MAEAEYARQLNKRGEVIVKVVMGFVVCISSENTIELQAYLFQKYVTVSDGDNYYSDLQQILTHSTG